MQTIAVAGLAMLWLGLLAGCGAGDGAQAQAPQQPPTVTVAQPLPREIVDWDDFVGRFEAVNRVEVRPRVSGVLQEVHFRDGQNVQRGQLLFTIDPRPFEAALAEARAGAERARTALELARTELERSRTLLAEQAVSREEYDTRAAAVQSAQAELSAAQAEVRAAALDVEFTRVRSPIAGRASDRRIDVGNLVMGGDLTTASLLTTITSLDPIHFVFDGSEAVYLKYTRANAEGTRPSSRIAANPVEIRLQDEPDYRWRGRMDFVDNTLDTGAGTIRGRALVPNSDLFLTPGMFGRMRLLGSGAYEALLVPDGAVQTDQTRKYVLVLGDRNIVDRRIVEIGPLVDGLRVVREGLRPGDRVIIQGLHRAMAGSPVTPRPGRIVPPAPGQSPDAQAYSAPPAAEATPAAAIR